MTLIEKRILGGLLKWDQGGSYRTNQSGELVSTGVAVDTGKKLTEYFHRYGVVWIKNWLVFYF